MSSWKEQIRREMQPPASYRPQPDWGRMAAMLDDAALARRRRWVWLLVACLGGLSLLGAGLAGWAGKSLPRQYAFFLRQGATPVQNSSPVSGDEGQSSINIPELPAKARPSAPVKSAAVVAPQAPTLLSHHAASGNHASETLVSSNTTSLSKSALPVNAFSQINTATSLSPCLNPSAVIAEIPAPPSRQLRRWSVSLRGQLLEPLASGVTNAEGQIVFEEGYGSQPGGSLGLHYVLGRGWELQAGLGMQAVWYPISKNSLSPDQYADIWGKALGLSVGARKDLLSFDRLHVFASAMAGFQQQEVDLTTFTYLPADNSSDPHQLWKFRKDLPASAVVTMEEARRQVATGSAGIGLRWNLTGRLAIFAQSQVHRQLVVSETNNVALQQQPGWMLDHGAGIQVYW